MILMCIHIDLPRVNWMLVREFVLFFKPLYNMAVSVSADLFFFLSNLVGRIRKRTTVLHKRYTGTMTQSTNLSGPSVTTLGQYVYRAMGPVFSAPLICSSVCCRLIIIINRYRSRPHSLSSASSDVLRSFYYPKNANNTRIFTVIYFFYC